MNNIENLTIICSVLSLVIMLLNFNLKIRQLRSEELERFARTEETNHFIKEQLTRIVNSVEMNTNRITTTEKDVLIIKERMRRKNNE